MRFHGIAGAGTTAGHQLGISLDPSFCADMSQIRLSKSNGNWDPWLQWLRFKCTAKVQSQDLQTLLGRYHASWPVHSNQQGARLKNAYEMHIEGKYLGNLRYMVLRCTLTTSQDPRCKTWLAWHGRHDSLEGLPKKDADSRHVLLSTNPRWLKWARCASVASDRRK